MSYVIRAAQVAHHAHTGRRLDDDAAILPGIAVSFVRHEFTDYDRLMWEEADPEVRRQHKSRILALISKAIPELHAACLEQDAQS